MKSIQKNNLSRWLKRPFRHYVKQALVPHKANQFRPYLIRRHGLVAIIILTVAVQVVNLSPVSAIVNTESSTETLLRITNDERERQQLKPLVENSMLSNAATLKAQDMLAQQYWAHIAPDGTTPWKWFKEVGYRYSYAGENLAKNFRTPEAIMSAWMASNEHRANILSEHYSEVGFALVNGKINDKPVTLTVALYGTPTMATSPTAVTSATGIGVAAAGQMSMIEQLSAAVSAMGLLSLLSVVVLSTGVIVALITHMHRKKMPKELQRSWYRHHGLLKAGGMLSLCFVIVFLYSGGQI